MAEYQASRTEDRSDRVALFETPSYRQEAWLGFAHEGLPAFGCFLGYNNAFDSWYASLRAGPAVVVHVTWRVTGCCGFTLCTEALSILFHAKPKASKLTAPSSGIRMPH